MAQADLPPDHLTDYERAVCYYALPRVRHPLTFGLIIVYAVCVLEAIAAILYGSLWEHQAFLEAGVYALGGMIVFGLVVFFARALLDDVRKRDLLQQARNVPDAPRDLGDLPNPFASHVLLRRPDFVGSTLYACTENDATIDYIIETVPEQGLWKVKTPQDTEVCRIKVLQGPGSFYFGQDLPRCIAICAGEEEIARIRRRFSFDTVVATIEPHDSRKPIYKIRQRGIYQEDKLVGRMYQLRGSYYLDVDKSAFDLPLLAYFVTVT